MWRGSERITPQPLTLAIRVTPCRRHMDTSEVIIQFGQYTGQRIRDLPGAYLKYLWKENASNQIKCGDMIFPAWKAAEVELNRRAETHNQRVKEMQENHGKKLDAG